MRGKRKEKEKPVILEGTIKRELLEAINKDGRFSNLTKKQRWVICQQTYEVFFMSIKRAVCNRYKMKIMGFGSFFIQKRKLGRHYDFVAQKFREPCEFEYIKFKIAKTLNANLIDENNEFKQNNR